MLNYNIDEMTLAEKILLWRSIPDNEKGDHWLLKIVIEVELNGE